MNVLGHIGFSEKDVNGIAEFVRGQGSDLQRRSSPAGDYLVFSDPSGAEVYFQITRSGMLLGYDVHYSGKSLVRVSIVKKIEKQESPLDAAVLAWISPKVAGDPESGVVPVVFEIPDYHAVESLHPFPVETDVQLAAFPVKPPEVFASREAYESVMKGRSKISAMPFIPSGLFMKNPEFEPSALITGTIESITRLINNQTRETYYHLTIETPIGKIDVASHPSFLPGSVEAGAYISGEFFLSGRVRQGC